MLRAFTRKMIARTLTDQKKLEVRRARREKIRSLFSRPHRVDFYFRMDDPYAYLLAQVLPRLKEHFEIELKCWLTPPPSKEAIRDREQWLAFAIRDAADLAAARGLDFPENPVIPDDLTLRRAVSLPGSFDDADPFLQAAIETSGAMWKDDWETLEGLLTKGPRANVLWQRSRTQDPAKKGHYASGTLYYNGEWYWGIDRLRFLCERLEALGLGKPGAADAVWNPEPVAQSKPLGDKQLPPLECYLSFRSPYTYLALDRLADLARRTGVALVLKPVLPMVTRGVPLPLAKMLYIIRDAGRVAHSLGLAFGNLRDPLGKGVNRCLAVFVQAQEQGKGFDWFRSAMTGIWAEGVDTASDKGLRRLVERAGLQWEGVKPHLAKGDFEAMTQQNGAELEALGLWGVPSFRFGSYSTWGQDRLDLVEAQIARATASDEAENAQPESAPAGEEA